MGSRIEIDVERLVTWAYCEELPKREVATGGLIKDYGELGTGIDFERGEPGFPLALGPPHPDALIVDYAVHGLSSMTVMWERSRGLLHGLGWALDLADRRIAGFEVGIPYLVKHHAIMGNRPTWDLGPMTCGRVLPPGSKKPLVQYLDGDELVDSCGGKHYRLSQQPRCPLQWDPHPADIVMARAEYAGWRAGLVEVATTLQGWGLRDHIVRMPVAPPAPWVSGPEPVSRVLKDLRPPPPRELIERRSIPTRAPMREGMRVTRIPSKHPASPRLEGAVAHVGELLTIADEAEALLADCD